ncbi:hypothetical protein QAD02_011398 [Eretmocerus hayati]|uniref:Uncharacterized protein n=1 Tax=Eretmocerus hayati TaxID=131215 RepID=A0ACC2NZI5_9HYME|nr:hypothetical protein QAD02_011398 [Eretmocerus hayati]
MKFLNRSGEFSVICRASVRGSRCCNWYDQQLSFNLYCTVTKNQVLTAASCIEKIPNVGYLEVIFGNTKPESPRHQSFNVVSKFTYEDWCKERRYCFFEKYTDDLAILKLDTFNVGVAPAPIGIMSRNYHAFTHLPGISLKITGWGHTGTETRPISPRRAYVQILSKQDCEERVRKLVPSCLSDVVLPDKILCGVADPPILAVQGDFGGPAAYGKDKSISAILIQRCPIHHPNDVSPGQVNLLLQLEYYSDFLSSVLEF